MTRRPEWVLIGYLWVCYVLNHADRQVVYTLFPALQKDFGLSDAVLGLTGALFLWVYGVCSPLAGILGDRWSKPGMVTGSLAVWSAFTLLTGFSMSGTMLLGFRALLGVSESMFMPAAYALIANAHGPETRSRAAAIFVSSQLVGVAAGGALSGWLAERFQWRASFWVLGTAGLLFAYPLWRFLSRVPPSFLRRGDAQPANLRTFLDLLRIPALRIVTTFVAIATFGLFLVYTWLPTFFFDKFSLGLARAGFEASVYPQIGTALGLLTGGTLADRYYARLHSARFWVVAAGFLCAAPCLFLTGHLETLAAARLAAMGFGFFSGFISGNQGPATFDVVPPALRASSIGVLNLLGAAVSGFAPFLGGLARRTVGVDRVMAVTGAVYVVTAMVVVYGALRHFERDHRRAVAS